MYGTLEQRLGSTNQHLCVAICHRQIGHTQWPSRQPFAGGKECLDTQLTAQTLRFVKGVLQGICE